MYEVKTEAKSRFTVKLTRIFAMANDQEVTYEYHTEASLIPQIISGWTDAGYIVDGINFIKG